MAEIWGSYIALRKSLSGSDQFSKGIYGSHYQRLLFERTSKESTIRFLIKALIAKVIFDEGHSFVCNWRYKVDHKVFDTIPIIDVETMKIYRFSNSKIPIKHQAFREQIITMDSIKTDLTMFKELETEVRRILGYESNNKKRVS